MIVQPKFDDCKTCIFYSKRRRNPICRSCDAGEFYEEKQSSREMSDDELMSSYKDYHDDDE